jgi:hypothetical protein
VGNEERRFESQLLEEWRDKLDLRFDGIIESQHYRLVGNPGGRPAFASAEDHEQERSSEQREEFRN